MRSFLHRSNVMARQCYVCSKRTILGSTISHAHNVQSRKFKPNLQRIRILERGSVKRVRICTRCIRSGKIRKAS